MSTRLSAIDFTHTLEKLTQTFIGRKWVFDDIDQWLRESDERFFILTGEPGVGKSAIAAQFVKIYKQNIAAYHFCIALESGTIQPDRVLLSLAAQLVDYFPDYAETLANVIKPLKVSIKSEINVQSIKDSTIRGVVIEHLHSDHPREALDIILRRTLEALPVVPKHPVLILIDSLDEAVTYHEQENLLTLLAAVNDLPAWVRIIFTSRPDEERVIPYIKALENLQKAYHYPLSNESEENKSDVREYISTRVESQKIQAQLEQIQLPLQTLTSKVTSLANGNFLFAKVLLDDIELEHQPLDKLDELPKSLPEFYQGFLLRLQPQWRSSCQRLLGILTVTKEPISEELIARFLRDQLEETEVSQGLGLVRQFLTVTQSNSNGIAYRLFHQSLQDFLVSKELSRNFWCSPRDQHRRIIKYYWRFHPHNWDKCDRYGLQYLCTHLTNAAVVESDFIEAEDYIGKLHQLLATETSDGRNAWFVAKDKIDDVAGFIKDVALAWEQLENDFPQSRKGSLLGRQFRYALMTASVNNWAAILPTEILVTLVEKGYWSQDRALAYAQQILDPYQKIETLKQLAIYLKGAFKEQAYLVALETINSTQANEFVSKSKGFLIGVSKDFLQEKILLDLAFYLPKVAIQIIQADELHLSKQFKDKVTAIAGDMLLPNEDSAQDLVDVSAGIPTALVPQALDVISREHQGDWLINLLPSLPDDFVAKAFQITQEISRDEQKSQLLIDLALRLPEDLLIDALCETRKVEATDEKGLIAATRIIARLSENSLVNALKAVGQFDVGEWRQTRRIIILLIEKLPKYQFPGALDVALEQNDKDAKSVMLTELASGLPDSLLPKAFKASLDARYYYQWEVDYIRKHISSCSLDDLLLTALRAVENIENNFENFMEDVRDEGPKARALELLIPFLTTSLAEDGYRLIRNLRDDFSLKGSVVALAQGEIELAGGRFLESQLAHSSPFYAGHKWVQLLSALVPRLPESRLPEVLDTVGKLRDENRVQLLVALAPRLPGNLLLKALKLTRAIRDKHLQLNALKALLPHLEHEAALEAFQLALKVKGNHTRFMFSDAVVTSNDLKQLDVEAQASTLKDLLPLLPNSILPEAFKAMRVRQATSGFMSSLDEAPIADIVQAVLIQDEHFQVQAMKALALHVPEALIEAFKITTLQSAQEQTEALADLTAQLPERLLPEVLEVIPTLPGEEYQLSVLQAIAPKLPKALVADAFQVALSIQDTELQLQALSSLVGQLPEKLLIETFETALSIKDQEYRVQAVLLSLAIYLQVLIGIVRDQKYKLETLFVMLSYLREILPESLKIAVAFRELSEKYRIFQTIPENLLTLALLPLIPLVAAVESTTHIPEKVLEEFTAKFKASLPTLRFLIGLIPKPLMRKGIETINSEDAFLIMQLGGYSSLLPDYLKPDFDEILRKAFKSKQTGSDLAQIIPHLPSSLLMDAFEATKKIPSNTIWGGRDEALAALAPRLPESLLPEALSTAQELESEQDRLNVLNELFSRLPEDLAPKAFDAVRTFENEQRQAAALTEKLISRLSDSHLQQVLAMANNMSYGPRLIVLKALIKRLPFSEALSTIQSVKRWEDQIEMLKLLVPSSLLSSCFSDSYTLWRYSLHTISGESYERKDLLLALEWLIPLIHRLAGEEGIEEVFQSVCCTARWWR